MRLPEQWNLQHMHGQMHCRMHVTGFIGTGLLHCICCCRLTALDLIQRDFVSLDEEPHSFPVPELSTLLQQLYGTAAAALALRAEQIRCREQPKSVCAASQQILKVRSCCVCCVMLAWDSSSCAVPSWGAITITCISRLYTITLMLKCSQVVPWL
jgi:hypothetical protein